jgi:hypothetical protein
VLRHPRRHPHSLPLVVWVSHLRRKSKAVTEQASNEVDDTFQTKKQQHDKHNDVEGWVGFDVLNFIFVTLFQKQQRRSAGCFFFLEEQPYHAGEKEVKLLREGEGTE